MKTEDLKNLALMGIAGGMILSGSQVQAGDNNEYSNTYSGAANGSAVAQGCGSKSGGVRQYRPYDQSREPVRYRYYDSRDQRYEEHGNNNYSPKGEIKESTVTSQLSPESLRIYYSMNQEGKELVLRLSKQYSNKNEAVRQAQRMLNTPKEDTRQAPAPRQGTRHSLFH